MVNLCAAAEGREEKRREEKEMKRFLVILVIFYVVFVGSYAIRDLRTRPCEEIYVVTDGETLQSISTRCNAPFILVDNPHVLDTDDVGAGTVLTVKSYEF